MILVDLWSNINLDIFLFLLFLGITHNLFEPGKFIISNVAKYFCKYISDLKKCLSMKSFLVLVLLYLDQKKLRIRTFFTQLLTHCSQWTLSLPPENIRKPQGFLFYRGIEKVHWERMG